MERRRPPQGLRFDDHQDEFDRGACRFNVNGGANKFDYGATPIESSSQQGVHLHGRLRGRSPVNVYSSTDTGRCIGARLTANHVGAT